MVEQGTPEWHALRCGKITASRIVDVMAQGRSGQPSATRARYMGELIAERLTGVVQQGYKSAEMERGNEVEDLAVSTYALLYDCDPVKVAFVDHPLLANAGASPDRLIGDEGLAEFKCPATHTHIATLLGATIERRYILQMQWQMACTGRKWCDFVSFDPRLPAHMQLSVQRQTFDAALVSEISVAVAEFENEIRATIAKLSERYEAAA